MLFSDLLFILFMLLFIVLAIVATNAICESKCYSGWGKNEFYFGIVCYVLSVSFIILAIGFGIIKSGEIDATRYKKKLDEKAKIEKILENPNITIRKQYEDRIKSLDYDIKFYEEHMDISALNAYYKLIGEEDVGTK